MDSWWNGNGGNDGGGGGPRFDSLHRERVVNLADQDFIVSADREVRKPDGTVVLQSVNNVYYFCADPFYPGHGPLKVCLGKDALHTKLRNVLCMECWQRNEWRIWLRKWCLWGLLYDPDIF